MLIYVLLAVMNGVFIGLSRVINGRLSIDVGPFRASFCNHFVGFMFLTTILMATGHIRFGAASHAPLFTYLGGVFGAFFVALNSYVLPRIGAVKTVVLVICGQMISGLVIDFRNGGAIPSLARFIGITMIIFGAYIAKLSNISVDEKLQH